MAAPHVAGIAALMASARPDLPAPDLRAALLQNARPGPLPVGSGYLYARGSVLSVSDAASLAQSQRPQVQILKAERSGSGRAPSRGAGRGEWRDPGHRPLPGRDRSAAGGILRKRRAPFMIRARGRSGSRLTVEARNATGKVLGRSSRQIRRVRPGKRDVHSGNDGATGRGGVVVAQ